MKTDQRILEVAMKLFLRYGYSRVIVADIVRELAISKKTVYNHFASKTEILIAALDHFSYQFRQQAEIIITDADLSLRQKLITYVQLIGSSFAEVSEDFWADLKRAEPEAYQRANAFRRDIQLQYLSQLFEEGVQTGYIRDDPSRHLAILMFIGAIQQLTDADFMGQFPEPIRQAVPAQSQERIDHLLTIILQGIVTTTYQR